MKHALCGIAGLAMSASVAWAEEITFDYGDSGSLEHIEAEAGDAIKVQVRHTCESFAISYRGHKGVMRRPDIRPSLQSGQGCENTGVVSALAKKYCLGTETQSAIIAHSSEYGGYEIEVTNEGSAEFVLIRKDGGTASFSGFCTDAGLSQDAQDLVDGNLDETAFLSKAPTIHEKYQINPAQTAEYIVVVSDSPWETTYSVGPVVSYLTNPRYYLETTSSTDEDDNIVTTSAIQRDLRGEDDYDLILAAFAHVSNRNCRVDFWYIDFRCSGFALTGGVGTSTANSLDYFIGLSYKFGSAVLTAGQHWGTVHELQPGYAVGSTTTDRALVTESGMAERTDDAFFLSLTYTFGDGADKNSFRNNIARIGAP